MRGRERKRNKLRIKNVTIIWWKCFFLLVRKRQGKITQLTRRKMFLTETVTINDNVFYWMWKALAYSENENEQKKKRIPKSNPLPFNTYRSTIFILVKVDFFKFNEFLLFDEIKFRFNFAVALFSDRSTPCNIYL